MSTSNAPSKGKEKSSGSTEFTSPQWPPKKTPTARQYLEEDAHGQDADVMSDFALLSEDDLAEASHAPRRKKRVPGSSVTKYSHSSQSGPSRRRDRSPSSELLAEGDLSDFIPRANELKEKREKETAEKEKKQMAKEEQNRAECKRLKELYKAQVRAGKEAEAEETRELLQEQYISRKMGEVLKEGDSDN